MLSQAENELLTRAGPDTPCGELMRRYWQPAALSEELPPGGPPVPIRLLGEDLVLFRDPSTGSGQGGRPGLVGLHCPHRGADLSYGRLEDGGLRCIYHGWLYDIHGRCLQQPGEPAGSTFHEKIRHTAYPCQEFGGLIFAYLGPGEPPLIPAYEALAGPEELRSVTKIYRECNYLQANEGNIDSAHLSFLHRRVRSPEEAARLQATGSGGFDIVDLEESDYGLRIYWVRNLPSDRYYLHVTNFVLPNLCSLGGLASGDGRGHRINWHVPIDDTHHWEYVLVRGAGPEGIRAQEGTLRDELTSDHRFIRTSRNRYLQDREAMKTWSFSGLGPNNYPEDACTIDGAGPIQDRTQEHLGHGDKAIVALRLMLMRALRDVQAGKNPPHVVRDPALNRFAHAIGGSEILPTSVEWRSHWAEIALRPAAALHPNSSTGEGGPAR